MASVMCRLGHTLEDPYLQCWCGEDPPHLAEGYRRCESCGIPLSANETECWDCGFRAPQPEPPAEAGIGTLIISFPWGEWQHPGGTVLLGRNPESPLATHLRDYLAVGKEHVHVRLGADGAFVREAAPSKHGTFVDGRRLAPGVEVPLAQGNRLRLGASVTAVVLRLSLP